MRSDWLECLAKYFASNSKQIAHAQKADYFALKRLLIITCDTVGWLVEKIYNTYKGTAVRSE